MLEGFASGVDRNQRIWNLRIYLLPYQYLDWFYKANDSQVIKNSWILMTCFAKKVKSIFIVYNHKQLNSFLILCINRLSQTELPCSCKVILMLCINRLIQPELPCLRKVLLDALQQQAISNRVDLFLQSIVGGNDCNNSMAALHTAAEYTSEVHNQLRWILYFIERF